MMIALNEGPAATIPLACVCGVELYEELARALEPERRVLGAYIPMDLDVPLETAAVSLDVPRLAARYIDMLLSDVPRGPYALGGYSFGGLIAYEMAQLLRARGEQVALVALFDCIMSRARPRLTVGERVSAHVGRLRRSPARFVSHVVEHARERMGLATRPPPDTSEDHDHHYAIVMRATAAYEAIAKPYDGPVAIWRADGGSQEARLAPDLGWSGLVPKDTPVHTISAEHVTVLRSPNAELIAREIGAHLARFDPPATVAS